MIACLPLTGPGASENEDGTTASPASATMVLVFDRHFVL